VDTFPHAKVTLFCLNLHHQYTKGVATIATIATSAGSCSLAVAPPRSNCKKFFRILVVVVLSFPYQVDIFNAPETETHKVEHSLVAVVWVVARERRFHHGHPMPILRRTN